MADVDDFKRYNDVYGHQAGDMALKIVAQDITRQVRQVDLVARYGGEEFAIILPNATKQTAHTLASRIRSSITQIRIEKDKASSPQEQITISIGLATYPDEAKTKDELIARADKALYKAKAHGKNRVFAFW
jgi:diguanylate cyclase (GGDEF)-like protein